MPAAIDFRRNIKGQTPGHGPPLGHPHGDGMARIPRVWLGLGDDRDCEHRPVDGASQTGTGSELAAEAVPRRHITQFPAATS
jgi:hypothetical protein